MTILVTGGAGFIGTHTLVELDAADHSFVVVDNFSNSSQKALTAVEKITNKPICFFDVDVRNEEALQQIFENQAAAGRPITTVIHFAALKSVSESVSHAVRYYDNNIGGLLKLLGAMTKSNVNNIVFSSSATVYGDPEALPFEENHPVRPKNPYGHTKAMAEQILDDWAKQDKKNKAIALRYFNPIGAHPSGIIGEDPNGVPNNIFPYITRVALGHLPWLNIFGNDYSTVDGTGVRDYLHVVDLAKAHELSVRYLEKSSEGFFKAVNLGTGTGTSVFQLVQSFELQCGVSIPYQIATRRNGDVSSAWANPQLAKNLIGWTAKLSIADMCRDGWNWQYKNPRGYN
ncbi:UDP-glucose 4-epimerase GalE [Achromobacter sp. GG226]|uniref:UDP-glucose 4-epimerase GalE n=1 Tax=Verticiella alkaliphila TaxID=2779529 RepID=UPI001C0AFAC1|nr:UDP-glucose 4-epimerase GalE [Verticiella sp. GG226]MBU4609711.1 UDP-glucose 4-epimerase GalE [Verticiella sp. GG226]